MCSCIDKTDNGVHVANENRVKEDKAKANEADQEEENTSAARLVEMDTSGKGL
jgi:hypothetical protein